MKNDNKNTLIIILYLIIFVLLVLLFQSNKELNNKTRDVHYIFTQNINSSTALPVSPTSNEFVITIDNISPRINYFSEGPFGIWGTIPIEEYVNLWKKEFSEYSPTAVIIIHDENENRALVSLTDAEYDTEKNTLTYTVKMLPSDYGQKIGLTRPVNQYLPQEITSADIFIDTKPIGLDKSLDSFIKSNSLETVVNSEVQTFSDLYIKTLSTVNNSKYNRSDSYPDSSINNYGSVSMSITTPLDWR